MPGMGELESNRRSEPSGRTHDEPPPASTPTSACRPMMAMEEISRASGNRLSRLVSRTMPSSAWRCAVIRCAAASIVGRFHYAIDAIAGVVLTLMIFGAAALAGA